MAPDFEPDSHLNVQTPWNIPRLLLFSLQPFIKQTFFAGTLEKSVLGVDQPGVNVGTTPLETILMGC